MDNFPKILHFIIVTCFSYKYGDSCFLHRKVVMVINILKFIDKDANYLIPEQVLINLMNI